MQQNLELWEQMSGMLMAFNQLQELMDDTYVAVGSKAFTDALAIYQYAKVVDHTGTLENALGQLGQRFARKTRKKEVAAAIAD
jgi:hemoglobin-like flavoprotein